MKLLSKVNVCTYSRMVSLIENHEGIVIFRSDFSKIASYSSISKTLSRLILEGKLIRVSHGIFAKTRINKFTNEPTVAGTIEMVAREIFSKLNIDIFPSKLVKEYNEGKTTQIPMGSIVNTGKRRINRKITVGNSVISYENNSGEKHDIEKH